MAQPVKAPIAIVPITTPVVHSIVANKDTTYSIVNPDTGRSHVNCADLGTAQKEKARLDTLSAQEKF